MGDENENKPLSRKASNSKDVINNNNENGTGGDSGEVTLKAKMSLVNGCTVIIGSIIGKLKENILKSISNKRFAYKNESLIKTKLYSLFFARLIHEILISTSLSLFLAPLIQPVIRFRHFRVAYR